jgi:hypothetical protein
MWSRQHGRRRPGPPVVAIATALCLAPAAALGDGHLEGALDLGVGYEYGGAEDLEHSGLGELRLFIFPGRTHAVCLGLEGEAAVAEAGLAYFADAFPLGYRYRGRFSTVSVCAGGGVRGLTGVLPPGWRARARADAALDVGLLRLALELAAGLEVDAEDRPEATIDEYSIGLRLHYRGSSESVKDVSAARGPFVGLAFERYLNSNFFGLVVGYAYATRNF